VITGSKTSSQKTFTSTNNGGASKTFTFGGINYY
jgi:hypothetical protein